MTALAHDHPFDPTYGRGLDELLTIGAPPAPADFDVFWRGAYAAARDVDVAPVVGPVEAEDDGVRVHGITYTGIGGVRVGGWLTVPVDGVVERGLVIGHGYGGRGGPNPATPASRAVAIYPCVRGLGERGRILGVPDVSAEHVLHGIEARETYIHGGAVADVWCGATALLELFPEVGARLGYAGVSLGGALGALALPWDERFAGAYLVVPSFGNHPLRATLPCVGSADAVQRRYREDPGVLDVLAYFDAATAATRIRVPVEVAAALFDPAVPPPGQFAVYNALGGERALRVLPAGHHPYDGLDAEEVALFAAQEEFFARILGR